MGVSRDCPKVWVPLLSQQRVKLRTSNFVGTFTGSTGTKAHENIGNSGRGRSQGVPKIFKAPICRVHCAVIFAIAQLSCYHCLHLQLHHVASHFKHKQGIITEASLEWVKVEYKLNATRKLIVISLNNNM